MKTICVVTGTRAEYGLLRWVMQGIRDAPDLRLQLVATGAHLSPEFGSTYTGIEADGFAIDRKVEMLLSSDSAVGVTKSIGLAVSGFADAFDQLRPDVLLVLGDRYEILAAAAAALFARIPVAHVHGGEATEGAVDDAIRHAVTKMSHLHFVAAEPYRRRVVQMGEAPERVVLVGGLGVDALHRFEPMDRAGLEASLGFRFRARNLLVTFHPPTLDDVAAPVQMQALLDALAGLEDTGLIFTLPNADPEGRELARMVEGFAASHPAACVHASLGQARYFSCIREVDAVVGNSSSGLAEVPSLRKPTINIGTRQAGRLAAGSVIDCRADRAEIAAAIARSYDDGFRAALADVVNPYGDGGASARIVQALRSIGDARGLLHKSFHDLPAPPRVAGGA